MIQSFDEEAYLDVNLDVRQAVENGDFPDLETYLEQFGLSRIAQGKSKFHKDLDPFNEVSYLERFPEVNDLIARGEYVSAFDHFSQIGYSILLQQMEDERTAEETQTLPPETQRPIKGFDDAAYLSANTDVRDALLNGDFPSVDAYLEQFGLKRIKRGKCKFHKGFVPFRASEYLERFKDVVSLINEGKYKDAFDHFCAEGYQEIIEGQKEWEIENVEAEHFDPEFYRTYYNDITTLMSDKKMIVHWEQFGKKEGRYANLEMLCKGMGINVDLSTLDTEKILELNPLFSSLSRMEILLKVLQLNEVYPVRISGNDAYDAKFYCQLGKAYMIRGEREKGFELFSYALYIKPESECAEHVGNYFLETGQTKKALTLYRESLEIDDDHTSLWLYININKIQRNIHAYQEAFDILIDGLGKFQQNSQLLKLLDETVEDAWNDAQGHLHGLTKINKRPKLMESVHELVSTVARTYAAVFDRESGSVLPALNTKKVLIIGDFHVAQCIRYRIDQKSEQLVFAGYEVTKVSWTELKNRYEEIFFHDIVIFYRVPSVPVVIKSIEKARSLKKITFYEIDDLIFDPVYPPAYETYGNNISIEDYAGLTYGMPLFHEAARLCEYAIGSTLPLVSFLEPLVTSGRAFLHRNGLDSKNIVMTKREKEYINIFYGSGTLAHNADFIDLTLGAVERILQENANVKLTIVGHLTLPEKFRKEYGDQVMLLEKTSTIEEYWAYLSGADINLAVLHNDIINNSKSELKWFEAAYFRIPSVVSNTQNYLDIIEEGKDALIASSPEEWYEALNILVQSRKLRDQIGEAAYEKVISNYSIEALSKNIDHIITETVSERMKKNG